jgi:hypothetical protein
MSRARKPRAGSAPAVDSRVALPKLRDRVVLGGRALGATFHDRATAVTAVNRDLLDIAFVRYNSSHSGAEVDVFPHIRGDRLARLFNFQSTHGHVDPRRLAELGLPKDKWRPTHTDHCRFALRQPKLDGLLCALDHDEHIADLRRALSKGPLTAAEASYLKQLSALDEGRIALAES